MHVQSACGVCNSPPLTFSTLNSLQPIRRTCTQGLEFGPSVRQQFQLYSALLGFFCVSIRGSSSDLQLFLVQVRFQASSAMNVWHVQITGLWSIATVNKSNAGDMVIILYSSSHAYLTWLMCAKNNASSRCWDVPTHIEEELTCTVLTVAQPCTVK